jgi:putative ABC transport system permease protein
MRALILLGLAARSVGRNMRRSALTASAMALGLALLVFSRALAEGAHEQWIDSAVRLGTGHVTVQADQYLETGRIDYRLSPADVTRVTDALETPEMAGRIATWTMRLSVSGLASSAVSALPVRIEGIDPTRESEFSNLAEQVVDGSYLQPGEPLQAFVGTELARRLDIDVGKRFVLTAAGATGEVEGQLMRVVGIFRTAVPEVDQGLIHIPIETARNWLQAPGAASTVGILLPSSRDTDDIHAELSSILESSDDVRVLTWRQAAPELDSAVRMDDYGDYVFHAILFAIVALAILNSIMMSVLGRRREFGILQAMGLTRFDTGLVVFCEGLFLTAASGVIGTVLGIAITFGIWGDGLDFSGMLEQDMTMAGGLIDPVIIPTYHVSQFVLSIGFIALIGTVSSLYPAFRASQLDVAEAMKFDQ